jgi:hypothetical protein
MNDVEQRTRHNQNGHGNHVSLHDDRRYVRREFGKRIAREHGAPRVKSGTKLAIAGGRRMPIE